jgi:hypothetical protein
MARNGQSPGMGRRRAGAASGAATGAAPGGAAGGMTAAGAGAGESAIPADQLQEYNPPFRPGVFTGSHAGQFAGTQPEQGAERAERP